MHILFVLTMIAVSSVTCGSAADHKAIAAAIKAHDRATEQVFSTTLVGNYADAGVSCCHGNGDLSVLLVKRNGSWRVLASGGGAYDVGSMEGYGIPPAVARKLARGVQQAICAS